MDKDIKSTTIAGEFALMLTIVLAVAKVLGIMPMTWLQVFTPIWIILILCSSVIFIWVLIFILSFLLKKVFR